jgi:hypothetical protein
MNLVTTNLERSERQTINLFVLHALVSDKPNTNLLSAAATAVRDCHNPRKIPLKSLKSRTHAVHSIKSIAIRHGK